MPEVFIPRLIALHRAGSLPFDRFCRHYPVDAINDAVADCRRGDTIEAHPAHGRSRLSRARWMTFVASDDRPAAA